MNTYSHINKNYNNSDGVILKIGLHRANRNTLNQEEGTSTFYLMMKIMNI